MPRKIDITGQKFGIWVAIKRIKLKRKSKWECQCEKCGALKTFELSNLKYNNNKHCKNCTRYLPFNGKPKNDVAGQRRGKLIALFPVRKEWSKLWWWRCKCDCGNETDVSSNSWKTGDINSCGCLNHQSGSRSPHWTGYEEISGKMWSHFVNQARARNLEFSITVEYIWDLFLKQNRKCALSGINLCFGEGKKTTASLDRIDSSKGYIEGNLQWVYKDVNIMKNKFDEKHFIEMCNAISKNQYEKNNKLQPICKS